jgi:acyl-CoA thioester hydrolase
MAHHFENNMVVQTEHLDDQNHVNNVMYVQFMQDIAMQHWYSISPPALNEAIVWVVKRHEIDYHAPAFLNDTLLLKTHTGEATAVTWDRHYEIIRVSDQKKIITAKSCWVMLDKKTGRPRRIDDAIKSVFD